MAASYNIGDKVLVDIPEDCKGISFIDKFQGQELLISKAVKKKGTAYYELEGAVSKFKMPYVFMHEWLRKAN